MSQILRQLQLMGNTIKALIPPNSRELKIGKIYMAEPMLINENQGSNFYSDVKAILQNARQKTYKAVNTTMVEAYWLIGRRIVLEEQNGKDKAKYGEGLIRNLSIQLGE